MSVFFHWRQHRAQHLMSWGLCKLTMFVFSVLKKKKKKMSLFQCGKLLSTALFESCKSSPCPLTNSRKWSISTSGTFKIKKSEANWSMIITTTYHQTSQKFSIAKTDLTLNVRGPSYLRLTRSISSLLMPWLLTSPWHQQTWYWLYRMCRPFSNCVKSMWRNDKMQIYVYVSSEKFST